MIKKSPKIDQKVVLKRPKRGIRGPKKDPKCHKMGQKCQKVVQTCWDTCTL